MHGYEIQVINYAFITGNTHKHAVDSTARHKQRHETGSNHKQCRRNAVAAKNIVRKATDKVGHWKCKFSLFYECLFCHGFSEIGCSQCVNDSNRH